MNLDDPIRKNRAVSYVGTFLFTWCKNRGVDLLEHIKLKMRYSASRPHKHGKKY